MLNNLADRAETFNNQSKGGAGGPGGPNAVGGAAGAPGLIPGMDGAELDVGDHTATDFAYHHGNGTGTAEF
jgi:hypothetical protein